MKFYVVDRVEGVQGGEQSHAEYEEKSTFPADDRTQPPEYVAAYKECPQQQTKRIGAAVDDHDGDSFAVDLNGVRNIFRIQLLLDEHWHHTGEVAPDELREICFVSGTPAHRL